MPAAPQDILNNVKELILNHIRQTVDAESDRSCASKRGGNDEDKLQVLDVELHAIEEILTTLQTGLRTWITQRKRQRNSLIRFNKLPLEISSNILWLSIADPWRQETSFSFLRRLRTISWVCSSWRGLVEGSPRFWSIIEFSSSEPVILDFLRKSGSSPLEIKCFSDGIYNCTHPSGLTSTETRRYSNLIAPHMERIQSLILSAFAVHGLLPILEKPAPVLEELRLELVDESFVGLVNLFRGQASRLRDVVLENIPFRWDSAVLAGLRSLKISSRFDYPPSSLQVRRLLEENPGLETMDIEDVTITGPERFADDAVELSDGGKPSRVAMHNMEKLRLCGLPFQLVRAVLDNVEIPSIKHFDLRCLFGGQPASSLLGPNMKHLVGPLLRQSQGTRRVEITFGKTSIGFEIYFGRKDPPIRIVLEDTALPMDGFGWLAENFLLAEGLPSVCAADTFQISLKFWGDFDMAKGAFIPILDQLGAVKVKALTIESNCQHGGELIKYLGDANDNFLWPLPHLTSLTIGGHAELANNLLTTLQRRKNTALGGALDSLRPAPLEVLDLESMEVLDGNVEEGLAECVSPSGTFIRARWQPFEYRTGFGDYWDDFDDDEEEEDIYDNYEPFVLW